MTDKKINITFDLETLGNNFNSPIIQIGAVKFTDKGEILDTFIRNINIEKLKRYDFTMDYSTIKWWFSQPKEAIDSVINVEDGIDLRMALRDYTEWIGALGDYVYWSHATFDPPILKNAFDKVGLPYTIPFRAQRDIRTLTHFVGKIDVERKGVHHNALDDCLFQVEYISKGLSKIKFN